MRTPRLDLARWLGCALLLVAMAPAFSAPSAAQAVIPESAAEGSKEQADRWMEDAVALYRSDDLKGALETLDRALAVYRRIGDSEGQWSALYGLGILRAKQREYQEALRSFAEALALARQRGDREDEASVLHEIAFCHLDQRQFAEANAAFERELAIQVERRDRKGEAETRHNLGVIQGAQGQEQLALEQLTRALAIRREVEDREGEARTLDNMGQIHQGLGQPAKALELYQQTLVLQRELGDAVGADETEGRIAALRARMAPPTAAPGRRAQAQAEEAGELNMEAIGLLQRGDLAKAQARLEQAVELYRKAGARALEGRTRANLAFALFSQGDYAKALELAQQALAIARETGDREGTGNPLNLLGLIHMVSERYPQASSFFQRTLAVQREHYDLAGETRTLQNIALVHFALGDYAKALDGLEHVLTRQNGPERIQTLLNIGATQARQKQYSKALESLQQVLAIQRKLNDPLLRVTLAALGSVSGEMGEHARALELFQEALAIDRKTGDRLSESGTLAAIGEIQVRQGEHGKALAVYQQALAMARELGSPGSELQALAGLGRLHEAQGRWPEALDADLRSIALTEEAREAGQVEELKIRLGERSVDLYRRAVLILLRLGRPAEAFDLAERARARAFLDQIGNLRPAARKDMQGPEAGQERQLRLALAGLDHLLRQERARPRAEQDAQRLRSLSDQLAAKRREYADLLARLKLSNPEYASLVTVAPSKLSEVQRLLEPDTTLVSYFVTPGKTVAFVVTREAFHAVELAASEQDLTAAINELRGFASLGGPPSPRLAQLHAWLVAPLRPYLGTPLVGLIPHGVLHLLPFAALGDGQRLFGDQYTLFHLPSASTLPFLQGRRKPVGAGSLLALAQGQAAGLPPLRHAEQEAQSVAALYATQALVGREATETALRARAGSAGVLHLAAHGQLNPVTPVFSRIVLAPDGLPDTESDGSLEVHEIYDLDLAQASLVVLSACQTQLGAQSQGDDFVGLNRAFLYAGTPTVVASLWSVDDQATARLMTAFHRQLRQGLGKAAALRAAQAEVRAEHPDPYYWASFVLTGDPK